MNSNELPLSKFRSIYNCSPDLTDLEKSALVRRKPHWHGGRPGIIQEIEMPLRRLIDPIEDILNKFGSPVSAKRITYNFILNEMHRQQVSFWAWSETDWVKLIGRDYHEFHRNHKCSAKNLRHNVIACAYFLCGPEVIKYIVSYQQASFANRIFGDGALSKAIAALSTEMSRLGLGKSLINIHLPPLISEALLLNGDSDIAKLTLSIFQQLQQKYGRGTSLRRACIPIARALHNLGILPESLKQDRLNPKIRIGIEDTIPAEWLTWMLRWDSASTEARVTRIGKFSMVAKAGRWLAETYPAITSPSQWTSEISIAYTAMVTRITVGQLMHPKTRVQANKEGKPFTANAKATMLAGIRTFFVDCQEWQWIPTIFDPRRSLATPSSVERLRGPNPRIIADDQWAKLLSAGLSLTSTDLPVCMRSVGEHRVKVDSWYPFELVKAVTIAWLFTGLRSIEIQRLRVGCIRWQTSAGVEANKNSLGEIVCLLDVPVSKTNTAFVKPIDRLVGEAIATWEKMRPSGIAQWDYKTGEEVDFLFIWRGKRISKDYINQSIIPMLCQKAGVPISDARGNITSHRARSTIATQLYNAREPMSLFELQEWLGHRSPASTQHYAKISPTKLTKAFTDAGYFSRNVRLIELLVDQEAIRNGAAAAGEPWRYYDLGHGLCTYDFFDQCPHRMACAKCSFYQPKESSYVQMIEAKGNLIRLQQSIPLSDEERHAVEDGITALDQLTSHLADVPTPQGLTPRQLSQKSDEYF